MIDGTTTPAFADATAGKPDPAFAEADAAATADKPDAGLTPENAIDDGENDAADLSAEASAEADEFEDVDFAGKQYRLPKELKSALMMQADYTRKTQDVAEQRKALEGERET